MNNYLDKDFVGILIENGVCDDLIFKPAKSKVEVKKEEGDIQENDLSQDLSKKKRNLDEVPYDVRVNADYVNAFEKMRKDSCYLEEVLHESKFAPIDYRHYMARISYMSENVGYVDEYCRELYGLDKRYWVSGYLRAYDKKYQVGLNKYQPSKKAMFMPYIEYDRTHYEGFVGFKEALGKSEQNQYKSMIYIDVDNADLTYLSYLFDKFNLMPNVIIGSLKKPNSFHFVYFVNYFDEVIRKKTNKEQFNVHGRIREIKKIETKLTMLLNGDMSFLSKKIVKNAVSPKWEKTTLFTGRSAYSTKELHDLANAFLSSVGVELRTHFETHYGVLTGSFSDNSAARHLKNEPTIYRVYNSVEDIAVNADEVRFGKYRSNNVDSRNCNLFTALCYRASELLKEGVPAQSLMSYLEMSARNEYFYLAHQEGKGVLSDNEILGICRSVSKIFSGRVGMKVAYQEKVYKDENGKWSVHRNHYFTLKNERESARVEAEKLEFIDKFHSSRAVLNRYLENGYLKKEDAKLLSRRWGWSVGKIQTKIRQIKPYLMDLQQRRFKGKKQMRMAKDRKTGHVMFSKEYYEYYYAKPLSDIKEEIKKVVLNEIENNDEIELLETNLFGSVLSDSVFKKLDDKINEAFFVKMEDYYETEKYYRFLHEHYKHDDFREKSEEQMNFVENFIENIVDEKDKKEMSDKVKINSHQAVKGFSLSYVEEKQGLKFMVTRILSSMNLPSEVKSECEKVVMENDVADFNYFKKKYLTLNDLGFYLIEDITNGFLNFWLEKANKIATSKKNKHLNQLAKQQYSLEDVLQWEYNNKEIIGILGQYCKKAIQNRFNDIKEKINKIQKTKPK